MFFRHLDLTAALRPSLLPDESVLSVQDGVGLYASNSKIDDCQDGHVYLTSHRVCYVDKSEPRRHSVAIYLCDVDRIDYYAGFFKSSPKVTLHPKSDVVAAAAAHSTGRSHHHSLAPPLPTPSLSLPASTGRVEEESASSRRNRLSRNAVSTSWICPICSFSNTVPASFEPTIANSNTVLPPCDACGVPPPLMLLIRAALSAARVGKSSDQSHTRPSPGSASSVLGRPTRQDPSTTGGRECSRCTFLNHPSLPACEMCHLPLARLTEVDTGIGDTVRAGWASADLVRISFRTGGEKVFHERLRNAMVQRKWLLGSAPPVPKPVERAGQDGDQAGRRHVGIADLERRGKEMRMNNERVISSAFEDLEALMASAKEIIALAESFEMNPSTGGSADALLNRSAALLSTTRDMLGSNSSKLYLSELARNLADFLTDTSSHASLTNSRHRSRGGDPSSSLLAREGGMMTVVDLWAIFNRARGGVELVSPADLAAAAEMWDELGLPIRLRRFRRSGVLVVQSREWSEERTVNTIIDWLREEPDGDGRVGRSFGRGVTIQEAADRFGWSVGIATEELEMAEESGALCREQAVDGLRFWENWLVKL